MADPPRVPVTGVSVSRRAAERLRAGHVWVYASDIESLTIPDQANPPALVPVADNRGLLLGTALYSPSSQIALRMVARDALDEHDGKHRQENLKRNECHCRRCACAQHAHEACDEQRVSRWHEGGRARRKEER